MSLDWWCSGVHGNRWGRPKTEVECDHRTRSGPWQFKSGKSGGLSLPGKPLKSSWSQSSRVYKLSSYVQEHNERTSFLGASHGTRQDSAMTGHEMLCGDLINTTHQKTQSTDCRIQTHINKKQKNKRKIAQIQVRLYTAHEILQY